MKSCAFFAVLLAASTHWIAAAPPTTPAKDDFDDPLSTGAKFRLGVGRFLAEEYSLRHRPIFALAPNGRAYAITMGGRVTAHSSETGLVSWSHEFGSFPDEADCSRTGNSVMFSSDGSKIATSGYLGLAIWDVANGKELSTVGFQRDSDEFFQQVAVNSDLTVAVTIPRDGTPTAKIWSIAKDKVIGQFLPAANEIHRVALSANGRVLALFGDYTPGEPEATGEAQKQLDLAGVVQLWDLQTQKEIQRIQLEFDFSLNAAVRPRQPEAIPAMKLSPDGKTLYLATKTAVEAWDTTTGKRIRRFAGRTQARGELWLSPDGKRLASAGVDGSVDVWASATGERLTTGKYPAGEDWQKLSSRGAPSTVLEIRPASLRVALPADGSAPVIGVLDVNPAIPCVYSQEYPSVLTLSCRWSDRVPGATPLQSHTGV
ncbi:MAG: hypothetical protein K8U57_37860 [Planctomycetes bacterium]|nr:hypothetical protein [Planctomycetota bacterium]